MHLATTQTRDTRRVDKLAGCTPLAVEMGHARIRLTESIQRHRKAQRSRFALASHPAFTRQRVREAVAMVRLIEGEVELKYGHFIPVTPAAAPMLLAAE